MHAVFKPAALNHRIDGVCGGADDIAAAHRFLGGCYRHDFHARGGAHLAGELLTILLCRTVDFDLRERTNRQMCRHLSPCLFTGAQQPHDLCVFARQVLTGDGAGGANAHSGNIMIVHDRQNLAGVHVEQHYQSNKIAGINAPLAAAYLDFLGKAGIDAQRHGLHARNQSHDVVEKVLPAFLFPWRSQPGARRIHSLACAKFTESLFDSIDLFRHGKEILHLFVFENQDHAPVSFRVTLLPAYNKLEGESRQGLRALRAAGDKGGRNASLTPIRHF